MADLANEGVSPSSDARVTVPAGREETFAAKLRGFGPAGILSMLAVLAGNVIVAPLSAVFVLVWAKCSRTPWREIGYVRPRSWPLTIASASLLGAVFKLAMKAVVMPLLGADPVNRAYHYLAHNRAAMPVMLFAVIAGAGFGEETVFRGWMFERLGKLFGRSGWARAAAVLLTSALFGAAHYTTQGLAGVEQAAIVGIVFGTIFAITGRLIPLMIAHASFDLVALAIIYFDVEARIAHLVFT